MPSLAFLTLVNLLNYLDRYLVAALLPVISLELSLSKEAGGRLVSAFVIGYVIFSPIFGYLGDRLQRTRLMAFGVLLWSLATVAGGSMYSLLPFFICRMLVGVGEASFGTISPGFIRDKMGGGAERINNALSVFYCAIPVGSALGYVLGGVIAEQRGWRDAFILCGLPGVVLAAAVLFLREPSRLTSSEVTPPLLEGCRRILANPLLRYAIAGYILNSFALNGVAAFVTTHGVALGYEVGEISKLFGVILVITGLLGTFVGGRLSSHFASREAAPLLSMMRFCGAVSVFAAPPLALAFLVDTRAAFLLCCFCAEALVFASVAPINSVLVMAAPPGLVTLTQGVTIFAINLFGAFTAPMLIGATADRVNLPLAMQLATAGILLSALFWWRGGRAAT